MKTNLFLFLLFSILNTCAIHRVASRLKKQNAARHATKENPEITADIELLWHSKNAAEANTIISKLERTIPNSLEDYTAKINNNKPFDLSAENISTLLVYALGTQNLRLSNILCKSSDARIMCPLTYVFIEPFGLHQLFACKTKQICAFSSWLIVQKEYAKFAFLLKNAKIENVLVEGKFFLNKVIRARAPELMHNALDQRWTGVIKTMVKTALAHPNDSLENTFAALRTNHWRTLYHVLDAHHNDDNNDDFFKIYGQVKLKGFSFSEKELHFKKLMKMWGVLKQIHQRRL